MNGLTTNSIILMGEIEKALAIGRTAIPMYISAHEAVHFTPSRGL